MVTPLVEQEFEKLLKFIPVGSFIVRIMRHFIDAKDSSNIRKGEVLLISF